MGFCSWKIWKLLQLMGFFLTFPSRLVDGCEIPTRQKAWPHVAAGICVRLIDAAAFAENRVVLAVLGLEVE